MAITYTRTAKIKDNLLVCTEIKYDSVTERTTDSVRRFTAGDVYLNLFSEADTNFNCYEVLTVQGERLFWQDFNEGGLIRSSLGNGEGDGFFSPEEIDGDLYKFGKSVTESGAGGDEFIFVCEFLRWNKYEGLKKIMPHLKMYFYHNNIDASIVYRYNYIGIPIESTAYGSAEYQLRMNIAYNSLISPLSSLSNSSWGIMATTSAVGFVQTYRDGDIYQRIFDNTGSGITGTTENTLELRFDQVQFIDVPAGDPDQVIWVRDTDGQDIPITLSVYNAMPEDKYGLVALEEEDWPI